MKLQKIDFLQDYANRLLYVLQKSLETNYLENRMIHMFCLECFFLRKIIKFFFLNLAYMHRCVTNCSRGSGRHTCTSHYNVFSELSAHHNRSMAPTTHKYGLFIEESCCKHYMITVTNFTHDSNVVKCVKCVHTTVMCIQRIVCH